MQLDSPAPDFCLTDQDGKSHSLSDYRGKWVFLYFYPENDTPGCTTEACSIRDSWAEFKNQDVVVVGISPDDETSHKQFQKKFNLPFTLLANPDKKVLTAYEAWGEKNQYGKIVIGVKRSSVLIDPEGKIAKWYKRVLVETHVAKVLSDLEVLREKKL